MEKIYLSCQKATELIEKKISFQLSPIENVQLNLHKLICDPCTLYEKQSRLLEKWITQKEIETDKNLPQITEKEVRELKEKILKRGK